MKISYPRILISLTILTVSLSIVAAPAFNLKNKSTESLQIRIDGQNPRTIAPDESLSLESFPVNTNHIINMYYCPTPDYCKESWRRPKRLKVTFIPGNYETVYIEFALKDGLGGIEPQARVFY
jgi:hypothetical protein